MAKIISEIRLEELKGAEVLVLKLASILQCQVMDLEWKVKQLKQGEKKDGNKTEQI